MPSLSGSSEVVADLEGDIRSAQGESYINGARRHPHVTGVRWSIQEEEGEWLGADGGVLGLLAQIYTGQLVVSIGHF